MMSSVKNAAAALALASFSLTLLSSSLAARSHGETARLDTSCQAALADLYATSYAPVPPATLSPCALMIEQALKTKQNSRCPDPGALAKCFAAAQPGAWSGFVHKCALFSTAPADPAAQAAVEAAASPASPIVTASADGAATGRRLLEEGEGEGEGEGVGPGTKGQGCFPNFKKAADFDAWLAGDFVETLDYGRASPIALASVAVFTLLLLSMAAVGLSGRWRKDKAASDSMQEACDAVALPWVLRKAVGVVKVLELEDTPAHFRTRLKAGGILDIVETYPWAVDAPEVIHGRRDKRKGGHTGRVERTAPLSPGGPPGAAIHVRWGDPFGGECTDSFSVSPDGRVLVQATEMVMAGTGERVCYKTIYRRERG